MSQIYSLPLGKENNGNKNKRGEDQRFLTRWDFFYFRLALPIYQSALLNTAALDPSYPSEGSRAFFSYSQSEIKLFFKVPTASSFAPSSRSRGGSISQLKFSSSEPAARGKVQKIPNSGAEIGAAAAMPFSFKIGGWKRRLSLLIKKGPEGRRERLFFPLSFQKRTQRTGNEKGKPDKGPYCENYSLGQHVRTPPARNGWSR